MKWKFVDQQLISILLASPPKLVGVNILKSKLVASKCYFKLKSVQIMPMIE